MTEDDQKVWQQVIKSVYPMGTPAPGVPRGELVPFQPSPIDLHGLTIQNAFNTLLELVERSAVKQHKHLIVITGLSGEIRREFPLWCQTDRFRKYVKRIEGLRPEPKDGAFRIYLNQK
jgi:hypothetical protein